MIPNLISLFRMVAFLPIIFLFSFEFYLTSFFVFTAAAWSDFLDGFLARRYKITSNLGSLLDLLADKILVSSVLIFLVFYTGNIYLLILTIIIILREISISSLRLFLVSNGVEISNVTADKVLNPDDLKSLLINQIEKRVRWRESIINMIKYGVEHFIEMGPGKILSGLIKRIDKNVKITSINNQSDVESLKI